MNAGIYPRMTPVVMATKFETKSYNSACIRAISELFASDME